MSDIITIFNELEQINTKLSSLIEINESPYALCGAHTAASDLIVRYVWTKQHINKLIK